MKPYTLSTLLAFSLLLTFNSSHAQELNCIKSTINKKGLPQLKLVRTKADGTCRKGSVLNSTGPAGAPGQTGTPGQAGTTGIINTTILNGNSAATISDPDTLVEATILGTVSKLAADSDLVITFNSHGTAENDGTGAGFCEFQIRINDNNADGESGDADAASNGGTAMLGENFSLNFPANTRLMAPIAMTGVFKNLTAGNHEVSLWMKRRSVAVCTINSGNYTQVAIVQEIKSN